MNASPWVAAPMEKVSDLPCTPKAGLWPPYPGWAQWKQEPVRSSSQGFRTNGGSRKSGGSGDRRSGQRQVII